MLGVFIHVFLPLTFASQSLINQSDATGWIAGPVPPCIHCYAHGVWRVLLGSAYLEDPMAPEVMVHDLSDGQNKFQWIVTYVISAESNIEVRSSCTIDTSGNVALDASWCLAIA